MTEPNEIFSFQISLVVNEIKSLLDSSRNNVARQVNKEILTTYWTTGALAGLSVNTNNPVRIELTTVNRL